MKWGKLAPSLRAVAKIRGPRRAIFVRWGGNPGTPARDLCALGWKSGDPGLHPTDEELSAGTPVWPDFRSQRTRRGSVNRP
jgi:hypothetical protein